MRSLDLFSGYAGITLALQDYVKPIAYVEIEEYAQKIIASRMADGSIPRAPILGDVKNVSGEIGDCDIIYGGFPCQDISVAGNGAGLAGNRSGLFFEIIRLVSEIRPKFVFLENVPAITIRGLDRVGLEFASLGYDCRWTIVSASEVGAPHQRDRWFLLAHANNNRCKKPFQQISECRSSESSDTRGNGEVQSLANTDSLRKQSEQNSGQFSSDRISNSSENVGEPMRQGLERFTRTEISGRWQSRRLKTPDASIFSEQFWQSEPNVGRVANGIAFRVDRIKALGNGVVPLQVRTAFELLMGLE